jgi:hypothetical protein
MDWCHGEECHFRPCAGSALPLFRQKHLTSQSYAEKEARSAPCGAVTVGRPNEKNLTWLNIMDISLGTNC